MVGRSGDVEEEEAEGGRGGARTGRELMKLGSCIKPCSSRRVEATSVDIVCELQEVVVVVVREEEK